MSTLSAQLVKSLGYLACCSTDGSRCSHTVSRSASCRAAISTAGQGARGAEVGLSQVTNRAGPRVLSPYPSQVMAIRLFRSGRS